MRAEGGPIGPPSCAFWLSRSIGSVDEDHHALHPPRPWGLKGLLVPKRSLDGQGARLVRWFGFLSIVEGRSLPRPSRREPEGSRQQEHSAQRPSESLGPHADVFEAR